MEREPKYTETDNIYMERALQLAARGRCATRSNPMVGAVIAAPDGRIIGEGWHRRYGQAHAEVNAVNSVAPADRCLLPQSTIYVTLEPCSHYGKTPPCAKLLCDIAIRRVVVGAGDPNPKVNGRGIVMLRQAGAEVVTGLMARESEELNCVFFTAQRERRPFVTLKWAQSADGFVDVKRAADAHAARLSTPLTTLSTMRLRADNEAILTTAATVIADNPRLTLRGCEGDAPRRFIVDRSGALTPGVRSRLTVFNDGGEAPVVLTGADADSFASLYGCMFEKYGVTSVLVEAGPRFMSASLASGAWDALRIETAPFMLGSEGAHPAPRPPRAPMVADSLAGENRLQWYSNNALFTRPPR